MKFPGVESLLSRYQALAGAAGVDPLGYYLAPYAYAELQILGEAVTAVGSLDQTKIAEYIHKTTFSTVVGDVKFAPNGEWAEARSLAIQFQNIQGNDFNQFRQPGKHVILYPPEFKSGDLIQPFAKARAQ